jgi:hypothetical protein
MSIELTAPQARAVAELATPEGGVTLHQLAQGSDIYATPRGMSHGYRIAEDGELTPIGETLPAASR